MMRIWNRGRKRLLQRSFFFNIPYFYDVVLSTYDTLLTEMLLDIWNFRAICY